MFTWTPGRMTLLLAGFVTISLALPAVADYEEPTSVVSQCPPGAAFRHYLNETHGQPLQRMLNPEIDRFACDAYDWERYLGL